MKRAAIIFRFLPSTLVMLIIIYLSLGTFDTSESLPLFPNMDKVAHFFMYFGFASTLSFDLFRSSNSFSRKKAVIIWLIPVIWGGAMELAQGYFTNNRCADWFDFLANSMGATIGLFFGIFVVRPIIKRLKKQMSHRD